MMLATLVSGCALVTAADADPRRAVTPEADVLLTPVAENILRVQVVPTGAQPDARKLSALVTPAVPFTGVCRITAKVEGGVIRFADAAGRVFLTQTAQAFGKARIGGTEFRSVSVGWQSGGPDGLYGLGAFQNGHVNLRGQELACHQKNLEDTVPMLVSSGGFGILWDNAAPFVFKAAVATDFGITSPSGGEADYFVIASPDPNAVIAGYRQLTGAAPLYPKWAFGYHQSKERYRSQGEVLDIAGTFRKSKFPCDLIIQDWQYWGDHGWNASRFDTARFPDAKGMVEKLHADNFHYIVSVWPAFLPGKKGSAVYDELDEKKYLSDYRGFWNAMRYYDCFNPDARAIVWKHAKQGIFDNGVDGWWLDASEPDGGANTSPPVDYVFRFGSQTAAGPFPAVANAYPFFTVKAFYDGQRASGSAKRVYVLTRSAYAGIQRLGACYWTGDTKSTWDDFRRQISACLGMSAAGIPYVNTDIGGFASGPETELAVRWFQFGAFCGEMRMHGTGAPREPWRYGKPGDEAYDTLLAFATLRYRLLPYLYSTAWQVTSANASLMRPLAFDFPRDAAVREVADEFMFGPALLVAPVVTPRGGSGQTIPAGALYDRNGIPGGLDGAYFKGEAFGQKVFRRKDAEIRFDWAKKPRDGMGANSAHDPIPALGDMDHFSVRWTGFLKTAEAGKYGFSLTGDDGFRLKLDGKEVCADWRARGKLTKVFTVDLPADKLVPVELDYFQDLHSAQLEWRWTKPSETAEEGVVRKVVLPSGADWVDFWTGAKSAGGQVKELRVPLSTMPLFVRAGSILPFGPALQHTGEPSGEPVELRVYPGADARFTLYDDAGDGYGYEKGEYAVIPLAWDDKAQTLTIGGRQGQYPGMEPARRFVVRLLQPDGTWKNTPVAYTGATTRIRLHDDRGQAK